jgi:hypothetical protein
MKKPEQFQVQGFRDKAILSGWIAGILLLISALWIFTQPLQANYLLRSVNNVLINNNDSRRLSAYLQVKANRANLLGYWFSMHNSTDKMFVFTVFQNGILIPLGAVVSADGIVDDIIPLSTHAVQVFNELPQSILQIYTSRIEESLALGDRE